MELAKGKDPRDYVPDDSDSSDSEDEDEFYTEGHDDLLAARRKIARYSLQKCVAPRRDGYYS
jgi:hypothetical protein